MRAKIIDRWQELEAAPAPKPVYSIEDFAVAIINHCKGRRETRLPSAVVYSSDLKFYCEIFYQALIIQDLVLLAVMYIVITNQLSTA
jgi:hypothetical protein